MIKLALQRLFLTAALLVAMGLSACGSGSRSGEVSGEVVAQLGATTITRAAVSHWMSTLAGGDYYELSARHTVPAGIVSDPPSYSTCVARLEAAAAASPRGGAKPSGFELLTKCRQLHQALKEQATAYLIHDEQLIGMYRDLGITVSDAEVEQFYTKWRAQNALSNDAALNRYLASMRRSVSDQLYVLKIDLLEQKGAQAIETGGKQKYAQLLQAEQHWTAKTSCTSGYVVQHCKQYKGGPAYPSTPPPSVLMEQLARLATGRCINLQACGKQ